MILDKIKAVRAKNPTANTWQFITGCIEVQLRGVENPFWEDLPETDICKVICQDTLHGLHKAFKDHTAQWNIDHIGEFEMDNHFRRMPKTPGFRHFHSGISKISQWSGREAKDIQRYFLAALYGAQTSEAIAATRAELDFTYHAQWKTHSESDLKRMDEFNAIFHKYKGAFLKTETHGGRDSDHFNIPKVHARHHYTPNIRWTASPYNYSTEISEQYHIDIAKKAYKSTNRKNYISQMLLFLTRQEQVHLQSQLLRWLLNLIWSSASSMNWEDDTFENQPRIEDLSEFLEVDVDSPIDTSLLRQKAVTPIIQSKVSSNPVETSHAIAKRPHRSAKYINEIAVAFGIPNLETAVKMFLLTNEHGRIHHSTIRQYLRTYQLPSSWQKISVWHRSTLTLPLIGFDNGMPEKRTILARLETKGDKVPRFQTVLVDQQFEDSSPQDGLRG